MSPKHPFHLIDLVTLAKVSSLFAGNYRTSFHGSGMEFSDIREYAPWDDVGDIDWRTSARTGKMFIKKYEEDRERRVTFLLDMSESMRFGSGERTKFDILAELFGILSFSSVENGDPTGTWLYSDRILAEHPPKKWHAHLARIRDDFDRYRSADLQHPSTPNTPVQALCRKNIRNELLFVLTDATGEIDESAYRSIGMQNDAIFVHIFDSFENELGDGKHAHAVTPDIDLYLGSQGAKRQEYIRARTEELEWFRKKLTQLGWSYLALDERDNVYGKLYDFFKKRQNR